MDTLGLIHTNGAGSNAKAVGSGSRPLPTSKERKSCLFLVLRLLQIILRLFVFGCRLQASPHSGIPPFLRLSPRSLPTDEQITLVISRPRTSW